MLQVKVKVILGIKSLQTAYITHHSVDYYLTGKYLLRYIEVVLHYMETDLHTFFAARENVNVSLFLPHITCYAFAAVQVTRKAKSNIGSGLVMSNCNHVWWRVCLLSPQNIPDTSSWFCQKKKKKQWLNQYVYPWPETNGRVWLLLLRDTSRLKTMTPQSIKHHWKKCP